MISHLCLVFVLVLGVIQGQNVNNRPIIGILAQKTFGSFAHHGDEYIDANYVKYLEMAGARVIAIKGNQPNEYYDEIFHQINGILLPGGSINVSYSPYANTSRFFYQKAIEANKKGDYFPIWGTCLGFEMLVVLTSGKNLLTPTDSENITMPLKFVPGYKSSRLMSTAPSEIIQYLSEEPVTAHFHHVSLSSQTYMETMVLRDFYQAISFNYDRKGIQFVSTFEAYNYPFYGTQWHPEKNNFLWAPNKAIDHTNHAIKVSQFMADFFVNEARNSFHKFESEMKAANALVENDHVAYFPKTANQAYFYNISVSPEIAKQPPQIQRYK